MSILDKITESKREEITARKAEMPLEKLKMLPNFSRECISLKENLLNSTTGIIAEFKRSSPSHPEINLSAEADKIAAAYEEAGACGISILTDRKFFGGTLQDLSLARKTVKLPLLRKDFMIDEYQIYEAKAMGADVILLIAALLDRSEIEKFSAIAKELGLEVLLEVHSEEEIEKSLMPSLDLVGVNNRDLKDFEIDLNISKTLSEKIPEEFVKISESGITEPAAIRELKKFGYQGFLIGGNFMTNEDPGKSAADFIQRLNK